MQPTASEDQGIKLYPSMLASSPASMVNQKRLDLGIPNRFKVTSSRFNWMRWFGGKQVIAQPPSPTYSALPHQNAGFAGSSRPPIRTGAILSASPVASSVSTATPLRV